MRGYVTLQSFLKTLNYFFPEIGLPCIMKTDAYMIAGIMIPKKEKFINDPFRKQFFGKWFKDICQYFLSCFCTAINFCIEPFRTDRKKTFNIFFYFRFR